MQLDRELGGIRLLTGTYNGWLVFASVMIAVFASYTALDMAGRVCEAHGNATKWWLMGGSVAMGVGIWSMHFIGMLAFNLTVPMGYDPEITILSLLIAIGASAFALWTVCRQGLSRLRLFGGAVLMGLGICRMHYVGMAAMRMNAPIRYVPSLFLASVAIAITASGAALWIAFRLRRRTSKVRRLRACAAVVMGIGIAGMHYTGMAAARFPSDGVYHVAGSALPQTWMAALIIVLAVAVLSIALIVSVLDFRASRLSTALTTAHQELKFLALHDNLTKLPNRALLEDRLDQEIENARRSQIPFSVFFLDLDGFKQVNDALGHLAGDLLLVEVADRIRSTLRARDTVARFGGDEFVVLADSVEPSDAAHLAEKLIAGLQAPFVIAGHDCNVTASVGIALYGAIRQRDALLKSADSAMYHAKALGRNNYCFFEAWMHEEAQKELQLLQDLRLALVRQEFLLHYQPKFDAKTGVMLGVEALIRWRHATRGMLSPGEFIPLAEKIGLILPIGEWTIQEACRQLSDWRDAGHRSWTVAVNLSATQFNHAGLVESVQRSLKQHELDPECLVLEITESTAMRDPDFTLGILQQLHQMGVRISIDDFGTGYSSLMYLKRLPARELKIDRGFVRDLSPESEDAAIISAIVALGRALDLEIVAEGVETVEQQNFLISLGCHALQGFLLGRPMPPDQLIAKITQARGTWEFEAENLERTPPLIAQVCTSASA